jgi:hypothetical protein
MDYSGFERIVDQWLNDEGLYEKAADAAGRFVRENTGATGKIMKGIV